LNQKGGNVPLQLKRCITMDKYYIKPEAWSKIYEILNENRKIRVRYEGKTRRFFPL
jgi:hypothetical protein